MPLPKSITRRHAIATIGGVSLATLLAACGSDSKSTGTTTTSGQADTTSTGAQAGSTTTASNNECATIPQETAGPFPGDGSNGPNVLNLDGVVRHDIRTSFAELSGTAKGIELKIELTITDAQNGCTPLAGAAVYIWHTDAPGGYSLYSDGLADQNYLRGVQVADTSGKLSFVSIFPGCYDGRWPHIHFQIYPDVATATSGGQPRSTSQLAFPKATCDEAYKDPRYQGSPANLARVSLESDMVFNDDGAAHQLATMSGTAADGYTAKLTIAA